MLKLTPNSFLKVNFKFMSKWQSIMVPTDSKSITIANPDFLQYDEHYSSLHQNLRKCFYWMAIYLKQEIELPEFKERNKEEPEVCNTCICSPDVGITAVKILYKKFPMSDKNRWRKYSKMFPDNHKD